MSDIISRTVRSLLGTLDGMRLYNRQEADEVIGAAKHLEEHFDPTIDTLKAQNHMVRMNADLTVARLENVVTNAQATTKVAVATASAVEAVAEQAQIYAAAVERVRNVAASVTPAYAAILSGKNPNTAPQFPEEPQSSFLQLPHRR